MFQNETENVPNLICESHFSMWNTNIVGFNCATVIVPNTTCRAACDDLNAKTAEYEDFIKLNKTLMLSMCSSVNKSATLSSPENCEIETQIKYNFASRHWESNGRKLDKLTWRSQSDPGLAKVFLIFLFFNYRLSKIKKCQVKNFA